MTFVVSYVREKILVQVTVQAVAGDSAEELELQLSFGDATLTWNTTTGKYSGCHKHDLVPSCRLPFPIFRAANSGKLEHENKTT